MDESFVWGLFLMIMGILAIHLIIEQTTDWKGAKYWVIMGPVALLWGMICTQVAWTW